MTGSLLRPLTNMRRLFVLALFLVIEVMAQTKCTTQVHSELVHSSILLCGRLNGGVPGARFSYLLKPGDTYSYPCPETSPSNSFEVYFSLKNDTKCTWDTCPINTGTCKSYPWVLGEGVSWQNGYWYGFVAANFDGDLGFTGNYGAADVSYGVQLNCSSYGTMPWNGTCGVSNSQPYCVPDAPANGKPDTGVVACGPAYNEGILKILIFQS